MMDVEVIQKNDELIVFVQTHEVDLDRAKIIEKIVSNLPVANDDLYLDFKGVKRIDDQGWIYLQSVLDLIKKNLYNIKIINLKEKKLVS